MIINMNGGGGASDVDFKVVISATRPSNPKDLTIWIESSTATGSWVMIDNVDGSRDTSEGFVVITYAAGNDVDYDSSTGKRYLHFKKVPVAVVFQKVYQRVSSNWISLNAYMYVAATSSWVQISSVYKAYISVTYPAGSTCKVTDGTTTLTAPNTSGSYIFIVPNIGTWTVSCSSGSNNTSTTVSITADGQNSSVTLSYNQIPAFTYSGSCKVVNDSDEEISVSKGDWNIKFLTSGTLTLSELNGASSGIDLFLVGGGGGGGTSNKGTYDGAGYGSGGGGGGYTKTYSAVQIAKGSYAITVGAGGSAAGSGGASSIGISGTTYAASGGSAGGSGGGGSGGSGGGAGAWAQGVGRDGGSNGANGTAYVNNGYPSTNMTGGSGQGTTTKAFGNASATYAYSQGGGGGGGITFTLSSAASKPAETGARGNNTGDGGRGWSYNTYSGTAGNSGIVIIRNHR